MKTSPFTVFGTHILKALGNILKHIPKTHDELLNECRRCPRRVVAIANALIAHNQRLAPKVLTPSPQNANGDVFIVQHETVVEEIRTLADFVESCRVIRQFQREKFWFWPIDAQSVMGFVTR
jgi:superfamily I DNA/RNA helicase